MNKEDFITKASASYNFQGEWILAGSAVFDNDYETGVQVKLPLKK